MKNVSSKKILRLVSRNSEETNQLAFDRIKYFSKVYSKSLSQRSASATEGSRIKHKDYVPERYAAY